MRRVSSLWSRAPTARHPFFVPLFLPASLSLASTRPSATFSSTAAQHNKHNTANNKHADPPTDSAHSFKTRLDYRYIRDNAEAIAQNIKDRSTGGDPYKVAALYEQKAASETELKHTQHLRKKNAKSMKGKLSKEERTTLIEQGKQLKETIAGQQEELNRLVYDLEREGLLIPNETHPDSPIGCEEKAELVGVYNAHINATGEGERDFPLLDHMTLGRKHKLFCLERGAISSGSNFYYLTNEGAMLEMALINYSFQKLVSKGFTPIIPPDLVRPSVSQGCGFTPRQGDSSSQLYSIEGQDLCLAATAEIPMAGYFADRILDEKELPQKTVAFGRAFRTEIGGHCAKSRGLYRVHQFSKVEIFAVSEPEGSEDMYNEIVEIQTEMFDELGLHFRVLNMPSEELGGPAYCKVDMEAWMPARGEFGEISSSSNCTDYQARRLNIRYKSYPKQRQQHPQDGDDSGSVRVTGDVCDGKVTASNKNSAKPVNRFVHTLNGTACAVPRMMIAIMEQNQQADGSIRVPDALQPFMMGIQSIPHAPMHVQHVTC